MSSGYSDGRVLGRLGGIPVPQFAEVVISPAPRGASRVDTTCVAKASAEDGEYVTPLHSDWRVLGRPRGIPIPKLTKTV